MKNINKNIKDFVEKVKIGQMIKIVLVYSWDKERTVTIKGIVVKKELDNFRIIPAYSEENNFSKISQRCSLEYATEINNTRFPKHISDKLKFLHKNLISYNKLEFQKEQIIEQMRNLSSNMDETLEKTQKEYVETSNNISQEVLFDTMLKDIREEFYEKNQTSNISVGFSYKKIKNGQHSIDVNFYKNTGRGIFSKDMYDSRTEFNNSNFDKLVERYCHPINSSLFNNKEWECNIEKFVDLGDKGSLETQTIVNLALKKEKVTKKYLETLKKSLITATKNAI